MCYSNERGSFIFAQAPSPAGASRLHRPLMKTENARPGRSRAFSPVLPRLLSVDGEHFRRKLSRKRSQAGQKWDAALY